MFRPVMNIFPYWIHIPEEGAMGYSHQFVLGNHSIYQMMKRNLIEGQQGQKLPNSEDCFSGTLSLLGKHRIL